MQKSVAEFSLDNWTDMGLEDAYDAVPAGMDSGLEHGLLLSVHINYREEQSTVGFLQLEKP